MRNVLVIGAVLLVAACGGSDGATGPAAVASVRVTGATTALVVGQTLQLTATPTDGSGKSVFGLTVQWSSSAPAVAGVDETGFVTALAPGSATITATAGGEEGSITLTVQAANPNTDCPIPVALSVGEVRRLSGAERSRLCVPGGASGQEYALIPFYGSATAASNLQLEAQGSGLVAASGPPNPSRAPGGVSPLLSLSETTTRTPSASFDARLRRLAMREVVPRMASARVARATRSRRSVASLSLSTQAPEVGSEIVLNAEANLACRNPSPRTGVVKAITNRAIIVADKANPPDGFTDAEYQSIGVAFDTLVYPVDVENFGAPSDIDVNGKSLIFFTRAVNELTPEGSDSYVGGFFFERDLLPRAASAGYPGCEGSNEAELFYMLVPDPTGTIHNNTFPKEFVHQLTVGVLAHEFQHLINASRRIYVTDAQELEEVWLNEGLSHIAEELIFYRASLLAPRLNIDSTRLRSSQKIRDAVNAYQISNLARLILYQQDPETNSPYADNDSLETRGATWQLLRYAADRKGGDERTTWQALVNSRFSGLTNIAAVFGDPLPLVRDWAVAQYTDDAVAVANPVYTHPSWSYRGTLPVLSSPRGLFPLKSRTVSDASQTLTLAGGGASYLRFGVPGGGMGKVHVTSQGATPNADVELMLVRTK